MKLSIQMKNIKEVSAKLEPAALYWPAAKSALDGIGRLGLARLQRAAPRGRTGQLASHLAYKVNDIPKPLWVVFKTDAAATPANPGTRGGKTKYPFPYPRRLEHEKKNPHYHWMKNGIQAARPQFRGVINKAASDIENNWGRI